MIGGLEVYQKYFAGMSAQEVTQLFLMPQEHPGITEGDPRVQGYQLGKRGLDDVFQQIKASRLPRARLVLGTRSRSR